MAPRREFGYLPSITKEIQFKLLLFPLLAAIALAGGAVGCGGSSDAAGGDHAYSVEADTTMTTASPLVTRPQFVKHVNRICRHAWITALNNWHTYRRTHQDPDLNEKARFVEAVQVSLLGALDFNIFDNIYQLGAPHGEERRIEKIIGPMQSAIERGWKGLVPLSSVALIAHLFAEYNRSASRYGLHDCLVDEAHLRPIEPG